jgi:spore coat protein CotH
MLLLPSLAPLALSAALGSTHLPPAPDLSQEELLSYQTVHHIEIELPYADWFGELASRHAEESYVPGTVRIDGVAVDSVGVRFKGNSSYSHPGIKKPFRLKYDEYRPEQSLDGLPSIVLNNGFRDPTMLRETIGYALYREAGERAPRTGFADLWVNGELIGFYTVGETVNKTWVENHIGGGEDGNLWKGDPHGDLVWRGADPAGYEHDYELKTNETENDWSGLIHFIDLLNNTPAAELPDSLADILEVDRWLRHHAVANAGVNLDAYEGSGHNYYIYQQDANGRFVHIPWDLNEYFGRFTLGIPPFELVHMPPLWSPFQPRPLVQRILEVDLYREMYLRHLRDLLATRFSNSYLDPLIDGLVELVRPHVYADPNKMYRDEDFDANVEHDILLGPDVVFGLKSFVRDRTLALQPILHELLGDPTLFINEILADNVATIADDAGDYDDYVELYNSTGSDISLADFRLTDDHRIVDRWILPEAAVVPAGGYLLLWLDSEPEQGDLHAPFSLSADGEELFLFDPDGHLIDFRVFDAQESDVAWMRYSDGSPWAGSGPPTPEAENLMPPILSGLSLDTPFPLPGRAIELSLQAEAGAAPIASVELYYDAGSGWQSATMVADGDTWSAGLPGQAAESEIRFYVEATDVTGAAATLPAGAPTTSYPLQIFVGTAPVRLNEFLADNDSSLADEAGEYEDWIELVNLSASEIDLGGYRLSDDASDPTQWRVPSGTLLAAGERVLIWADNDPEDGPLHATFKLSKSGEFLGLYAPDYCGNAAVDEIEFGAQATDLSQSRVADGLGAWQPETPPTPEEYNGGEGLFAWLAPASDPVVIPAGGGLLPAQATIFNRGPAAASEARTAAILPGGDEIDPLQGPLPISVATLDYVTTPVAYTVPGNAPSGSGRLELRVGLWGEEPESVSGFEVIIEE